MTDTEPGLCSTVREGGAPVRLGAGRGVVREARWLPRGPLRYTTIVSLDGYVADAEGRFDWAAPDEQVHAFVNDLMRPVATYLYGRRMYDVMSFWETAVGIPGQDEVERDFAGIWRSADKVVYSGTLAEPVTARTRIERSFAADSVRRLKAEAAGDLRHRRTGPCRARLRHRPGRRDAPVRRARRDRIGKPLLAGRHSAKPRPARRAALQQRLRVPALPHPAVTAADQLSSAAGPAS